MMPAHSLFPRRGFLARSETRPALIFEHGGAGRKRRPAKAFRPRRPIDEQREGLAGQSIDVARFIQLRVSYSTGGHRRVDQRLPRHWRGENREAKIESFWIGVHHDKKALVDVALSTRSKELASRSAQDETKGLRGLVVPVLGGGLSARRHDPSDVLYPGFREHFAA